MGWDYKNDPVLRVALVILIGILAFGILFNTYTGGENPGTGGHIGHSGENAYSFGGLIGGLIVLLLRLMLVIFVLAVIAGIYVWFKNNYQKKSNSRFVQSIKNDPALRSISMTVVMSLLIILIFYMLNGLNPLTMGSIGHSGSSGFITNSGYGMIWADSIFGILSLLIKLLILVLIVSLTLALFVYIKNQNGQSNMNIFGFSRTQGENSDTGAKQQENTNNTE